MYSNRDGDREESCCGRREPVMEQKRDVKKEEVRREGRRVRAASACLSFDKLRKTDAMRTRCQRSSEKRTDTQFVSNIKGRRESQTNHAEIIGCNDEVQAHTCVERHKSERSFPFENF
ncbi:hypothetical protein OUZ56_004550 [Daphnia magna]|uniref:Uncharacterized protein n=1 Tax=Daphnia magna TaxID=35525 RepID=A0ABQ9YQ47_9CRUS|nr:hypothetical protein OUZ56_004550 [Daphnia magna]